MRKFGPLYMNLLFESETIKPLLVNGQATVIIQELEYGNKKTFNIPIKNTEINISVFLLLIQKATGHRFRSQFFQNPEFIDNSVIFYVIDQQTGQRLLIMVTIVG